MKALKLIIVACVATLGFASCNTYSHSMKEPNSIVELKASDFELSEQFTAEAEVSKILFIDWTRVFGDTKSGSAESNVASVIPVIGGAMTDASKGYALYKLMEEHPGYDVVVYPQYEIHKTAPILGTDFFSHKTIKVTARLGKLK